MSNGGEIVLCDGTWNRPSNHRGNHEKKDGTLAKQMSILQKKTQNTRFGTLSTGQRDTKGQQKTHSQTLYRNQTTTNVEPEEIGFKMWDGTLGPMRG